METKYSKITLLVDMDDTIEDLLPAWIQWINENYGTDVRVEDVTEWEIAKFFPSLTRQDVYRPLYNDEFWKTVEPKDGAQQYLKRLIDSDFKVYICTNSNYQTVSKKLDYVLGRYFPFISWGHVITIENKQLLNADMLIDDGVHNLVGGNYLKMLMTAPHNKRFDAAANGIIRVNNWQEAYDQIIMCANQIIDEKAEVLHA